MIKKDIVLYLDLSHFAGNSFPDIQIKNELLSKPIFCKPAGVMPIHPFLMHLTGKANMQW
jgi:hypothetical protein